MRHWVLRYAIIVAFMIILIMAIEGAPVGNREESSQQSDTSLNIDPEKIMTLSSFLIPSSNYVQLPLEGNLSFSVNYIFDNGTGITGATVICNWTDGYSVTDLGDGDYEIYIFSVSTPVGSYTAHVTASSPFASSRSCDVSVDVITRYTQFYPYHPIDDTYYFDNMTIDVFYRDVHTSLGIENGSTIGYNVLIYIESPQQSNLVYTVRNGTIPGDYQIQLNASQWESMGTKNLMIYVNWTGPTELYSNNTISIPVTIISISTDLALVYPSESTETLMVNVTYGELLLIKWQVNNTEDGVTVPGGILEYYWSIGSGIFDDIGTGEYNKALDTSLLPDVGQYVIVFNWSRSGYTNCSAIFTINIIDEAHLSASPSPFIDSPYGYNTSCIVEFKRSNGTGIESAIILCNWTDGYFVNELGNGVYEIILNTEYNSMGSYVVLFNATAPFFEWDTVILYVEIRELYTSAICSENMLQVTLGGFTSFRIFYWDSDHSVQFAGQETAIRCNWSEYHSYGDLNYTIVEVIPGEYEVTLYAMETHPLGVFVVFVYVEQYAVQNHTSAITVLVKLNPAVLELVSSPDSVLTINGIETTFTVQYRLVNGTPINDAEILCNWNGTIASILALGNGQYEIVILEDLESGLYNIRITANAPLMQPGIETHLLWVDTTIPNIASPADFTIRIGEASQYITWYTYDENPWNYTILLDEVLVQCGTVNETSQDIVYNIPFLDKGVYNYTIYVNDGKGNWNSSFVLLTTAYEDHSPIQISGNTEFLNLVSSEGWFGSGTVGDPFIISGYSILCNPTFGLHIENVSRSFTVYDCSFVNGLIDQEDIGISLLRCSSVGIYHCNFTWLHIGIQNQETDYTSIDNGNFTLTKIGIYLIDSTLCNITFCHFKEGGVTILGDYEEYWHHFLTNNTVAAKYDGPDYGTRLLGYFYGENGITLQGSEYGQIILVSCDSISIDAGELTAVDIGLQIAFSSNCDTDSVAINQNRIGANIFRSVGIELRLSAWGSTEFGVLFNSSVDCKISFAVISQHVNYAIFSMYSENLYLSGCYLYDNNYGIGITQSNGTSIRNCKIYHNVYGISAWSLDKLEITLNEIYNNTGIGIEILSEVINSDFFANVLNWNFQNAADHTIGNSWDDGIGVGNSWSDYGGSGDYVVPGTGDGVDHFPINDATFIGPIQISHPPDSWIYSDATTSGLYWWFLSESSFHCYWYRNGTAILHAWTAWVFYRLDWIGAGPGVYNITLVVRDINGFEVTDLVWLTIYDVPAITDVPSNTYVQGETFSLEWTISNIIIGNYTIKRDGTIISDGVITSGNQIVSIDVNATEVGYFLYTCEVDMFGEIILSDSASISIEPDIASPTINHPDDISYIQNDTGYSIVWTPYDILPHYYEIFRDGSMLRWGWWNSSSETIQIGVDGLSSGQYTYWITVCDISWNNATDYVNVTVFSTPPPIVNHPDDIYYYYGDWGYTITWDTYDDNPSIYVIDLDGVAPAFPWVYGDWNISLDVSGLEIGLHNATIFLYDTDGQMISDTVYIFVLEDVTPSSISSPLDVELFEGEEGYIISWTVSDNNPCYYALFKNGDYYLVGEWNSSMTSISVGLDGLSVGTYNYTLLVSDCVFNVSDSVYVTVHAYDDPYPELDSPADVVMFYGTLGETISWNATDSDPNTFAIFRNGTLVRSGPWTSGEPLTVTLDGLFVGTFMYEIIVTDIHWQNATDTVFVFVLPSGVDIDSPADILYEAGTTGNEVTWTLLSGIPTVMQIYRNDSLIISTVWSGLNYTLNVDYLALGRYNFTVMVWDVGGGFDKDMVWVTVVRESSITTTTSTNTTNTTNTIIEYPEWIAMVTFFISIGSAVVIVIVIVIIYRSRSAPGYEF